MKAAKKFDIINSGFDKGCGLTSKGCSYSLAAYVPGLIQKAFKPFREELSKIVSEWKIAVDPVTKPIKVSFSDKSTNEIQNYEQIREAMERLGQPPIMSPGFNSLSG